MKVFVAGHNGMVGSAIVRQLKNIGIENIITQSSKDLDLRNQPEVNKYFEKEKPQIVIDAAARVGGILANNDYPYNFLMENMLIQNNLIEASLKHDVAKFIFLGSSCIYPKLAPQPLKEEYLLTGPLEPTNEWYAIAKISGVKACEAIRKQFNRDFVSLMPTNLYGPFDNFDLQTSHVLPAMIRKFHESKAANAPVTLWGTGTPMREFLYVDDLAKAVTFMINHQTTTHLYNVGFGDDLSIKELATSIQEVVGHKGELIWDSTKPDGTPKKLMDSSKIMQLGWKPEMNLKNGISTTYEWFLANIEKYKKVVING
jgi:GDP-L-fucose synthase